MKGNIYRDLYIGELSSELEGKEIRIAGWIEQIRNLGTNLMFLLIRDETGTVQVICNNPEKFNGVTRESTITLSGKIAKRILEDDNMQDIIREERQTLNLNDNEIFSLAGVNNLSNTPFQKMTFTIKVCGSEFTITCLDDGVYKPGSQKPEFTGRFSANTKNNNYLYRSSFLNYVTSKITKAIESAYSSDDINKDVKSMYKNRLAKAQSSVNEVDKISTEPVTVNGNNGSISVERDRVVEANWNAVATASRTETDVPSCTKERPGGEILAQDLTIKIAA